jgi:hypothetical protein
MKPEHQGYRCHCSCHDQVTVHIKMTCDCGKPITPAPGCAPPKRPKCPPPPPKTQPGTVNLPQDPPPPETNTSNTPPWTVGKPPDGDPNQIPWFRGQINGILRNGPSFGPRKDEYLPYLLIRANSGDRGGRPVSGGVFWESPDIYVSPNQEASSAPLNPPALGGVAVANAPNTLYAHVWNLGKSPAYRVRVEFYWFNPSLGISRADANLIGAAWIDLGNRFTLYPHWVEVKESYGQWLSQGCHAIVRCPETWVPTFENNGHECLVVRIFEPLLDSLDPNQFSAGSDRHVGQRNIAVVQAASPASIDLGLSLGYPDAPSDAEVDVSVDGPEKMEWLQLYAGTRDPGFAPPAGPPSLGFFPPTAEGTRVPALSRLPADAYATLLRTRERFHRGCCPFKVSFHATAENLKHKEAQVLRIRQRVNGEVVGGYSVILLKT